MFHAPRPRDHHDVAAVIPYLIGYHPTDTLVCVAVQDGLVTAASTMPLPDPHPEPDDTARVEYAAQVTAEAGTAAIVVGYGPGDRVNAATTQLTAALTGLHVPVLAALRVGDGRVFCLGCGRDCPTDGIPYDPSTSPVVTELVCRGAVALPDAAAFAARISPVDGPARKATDDASTRGCVWMAQHLHAPVDQQDMARIVARGVGAVDRAHAAAERGETLTDDDLGWLTALLLTPQVRTHAWTRTDGSPAHEQLWTDVLRRATPELAAAPACLLAITASLTGKGPLARLAVERALQAGPDDPFTQAISHAVHAGLPPSAWRDAITRIQARPTRTTPASSDHGPLTGRR